MWLCDVPSCVVTNPCQPENITNLAPCPSGLRRAFFSLLFIGVLSFLCCCLLDRRGTVTAKHYRFRSGKPRPTAKGAEAAAADLVMRRTLELVNAYGASESC